MNRWVYYTVLYHHPSNTYVRFLLTAIDVVDAENKALSYVAGKGYRTHYSEMVCSTTDAPFFKEA